MTKLKVIFILRELLVELNYNYSNNAYHSDSLESVGFFHFNGYLS